MASDHDWPLEIAQMSPWTQVASNPSLFLTTLTSSDLPLLPAHEPLHHSVSLLLPHLVLTTMVSDCLTPQASGGTWLSHAPARCMT